MTPLPALRSLSAAALIALCVVAAGCGAGRTGSGVLDVAVENESFNTIYDVDVRYGTQRLEATTVAPNEQVADRFVMLQQDTPLRVQYRDADNARVERSYEVKARPADGGNFRVRIEQDGSLRPVSRFDLYE